MNCNYNDSKPFDLKCFPNVYEIKKKKIPSSKFKIIQHPHLQLLKSKAYSKISALHFKIVENSEWMTQKIEMKSQKRNTSIGQNKVSLHLRKQL